VTRIVAIAGSLSRPSRTRLLVEHVAGRVAARTGGSLTLVDVAELAPDLGRAFSRKQAGPALEAALRAVEAADLIVAGSPVYKGSYTGFFKHFVDLLDFKALAGAPVALLATGGSDRHALMVEHQMRPLFASFDAFTLPTAAFVLDRDVTEGRVLDERVASRLDALVDQAAAQFSRRSAAAA
jgi:FMN reductase